MDMMEIRRKIMSNPPLVAPGYMKVEYIQNTDWAKIDTGYVPVQGDEFEIEFMQDQEKTGYQGLFSAGTGTYQIIALAYISSKKINYYAKYFASGGAKTLASQHEHNIWYTMRVTADGTFSCNGASVISPYEHILDGNKTTLYIFRRRDDNSSFAGKLKLFKITNNGTLKMNLIPCVRMTDNVAGVYDTVSKVFLTSQSSDYHFIPGNPVY